VDEAKIKKRVVDQFLLLEKLFDFKDISCPNTKSFLCGRLRHLVAGGVNSES